MVVSGMSAITASNLIENDRAYWGVKAKIRQLDQWTQQHCTVNGSAFTAFVGSAQYAVWEADLYRTEFSRPRGRQCLLLQRSLRCHSTSKGMYRFPRITNPSNGKQNTAESHND